MKANAYSIWWEQIINFLLSRLKALEEGHENPDKVSVKSVWISYWLIEEETKWLYMKNFLKEMFPSQFKPLLKLEV